MTKRILFVDDEETILEGLRRLLRPMRSEWDMEFVTGGDAALEAMTRRQPHVLVTDMRMEGMDGAELMEFAKDIFPDTARVIMAGQQDYEDVLGTVKTAHQFLHKPCSASELIQAVHRATRLRKLVRSPLRTLAHEVEQLPSPPAHYLKLERELNSPEPSIPFIGELIGQDPALSAGILKVVNSSFFGFLKPITTPAQAVSLLGLDTVRGLVLGVQLFSTFEPSSRGFAQLGRLWDHSIRAGAIARLIAQLEVPERPQLAAWASIAGLVHDVGKLALATRRNEDYAKLLERNWRGEGAIVELEEEQWGGSHAEVGGYILGLWGQDTAIMDAVLYHHHPSRYDKPEFSAVAAVHAAELLEHELFGWSVGPSVPEPDVAYLESLVGASHMDVWREACKKQFAE